MILLAAGDIALRHCAANLIVIFDNVHASFSTSVREGRGKGTRDPAGERSNNQRVRETHANNVDSFGKYARARICLYEEHLDEVRLSEDRLSEATLPSHAGKVSFFRPRKCKYTVV